MDEVNTLQKALEALKARFSAVCYSAMESELLGLEIHQDWIKRSHGLEEALGIMQVSSDETSALRAQAYADALKAHFSDR